MKLRLSSGWRSTGEDHGLTPREFDVMGLAGEGRSRKEVADSLNISINTVGTHLKNVYRKLEVRNLAGALKKLERRPNRPGMTDGSR